MMESGSHVFQSLAIPDILTPAQFYGARRGESALEPMKRLMFAVLHDAIRCFYNNGAKTDRQKQLCNEAEQWLFSEDDAAPFTFVTICEAIGIDPDFLRAGLRLWRTRQLAGISTPRLERRSAVIISRPQQHAE